MIDYNKRLVEVDVILSHLSENDYKKIPQDIIQGIRDNMDKDYKWEFDESKPLKDQEVSRDTIAFLSYINMEYLLNAEQKEYMQKIHELNEQKLEQEKLQQYNPEELFKDKKQKIEESKDIQTNKMIVYKENIFSKVLKAIKNLLKINR